MTPTLAIADLDSGLAVVGEPVTIRRYTAMSGTPRPKTDIDVTAAVRPVRADQLVGNIDETFSNVVLSPTGLASLLPLGKGDKAVIQGRERNIELVKPILMGGTLVRIDLVVAG